MTAVDAETERRHVGGWVVQHNHQRRKVCDTGGEEAA